MYENFNQPLASRKKFHNRVIQAGTFASIIFVIALSIGVSGYHFIVKLDWVDAFLNAAMILGGMGQISELPTDAAKIFAGCFALFSGVTFISSIAIFLAPIIHRFLHKFHISVKSEK
ncbi:MAG: hypothetical protein M3R36_17780 [Bacteroidota bacterium]|nr:hypothetical protein [Bacteroidota bacterium]